MAETLSYVFYDEATFTTSAGELQLFATPLGASGRTRYITNSPNNSSMKNNESFTIERIRVWLDSIEIVADLEKLLPQSYLRVLVKDKEVLILPLALCAGGGAWQGEFHEATNTLGRLINFAGDGFKLDIPIVIPKGEKFELYIGQGTALANAAQIKVALLGRLTRE